jgi:hypothetical protein
MTNKFTVSIDSADIGSSGFFSGHQIFVHLKDGRTLKFRVHLYGSLVKVPQIVSAIRTVIALSV